MELDKNEMHEAHRLLRQGTGATLAITPPGFPGRIVWTGYTRLADVEDPYGRWLQATPLHFNVWSVR